MDNVTHAALGLSVGLVVARRGGSLPAAAVAALLAAEAPDLDVLIRNGDDPLTSFRWHRHFTHSFVFMPVWALLSAWLTSALFRWRRHGEEPWRGLFLPALAGALTHLLCDGCTSYGTMLLWPFDEARFAWDCLPIVDLFATLPLLALTVFAYRRASRRLAAYGLLWFTTYAGLGAWQHHRAEAGLRAWLAAHGIEPARLTAKPTISNLVLWRGIWLHGDRWQVAAIHVSPWGEVRIAPGETKPAWTPTRPGTPPAGSLAEKQFADFSRFTQGWNTYAPFEAGMVVGDIRFGMLPTSARSLWSVSFGGANRRSGDASVELLMDRSLEDGDWGRFWGLLTGTDGRYVPAR